MEKQPKKAKTRKIKDLAADASKGAKIKGGRDLVPDRREVIRELNKVARPKA